MRTGGARRAAPRVGAALLLGLALVVGGWALRPSKATAAPAVTVYIRDLTPPVVSVDKDGTVTFINQIADKTLSVGVGPLAVTAVVHTDVTVNLPSGSHTIQPSPQPPPNQPEPALAPNQSWTEKFTQSCVTCTISYAYRVQGAQLAQVINLLPQLPPLPTPFVVNTLLPLPNLPGVNLPQLPQVNVPLPKLPVPGQVPTLPQQQSVTSTITTTTTTTTVHGIAGAPYRYDLSGLGMSPQGGAVVPAYTPTQSRSSDTSSASGQSNQLGNPRLSNDSAAGPVRSAEFSLPALLALLAVAGAGSWLVRTWYARAE